MEDDNNFNFNFLLGGNFSLQNWYVLLHTMFNQKIEHLNFRNVHKTLVLPTRKMCSSYF